MINRERIIETLQCRKVDRAPFPFWLGFAPWGETLARWCKESGMPGLKPESYFGFEPFFSVASLEYGPLPHFEEKVLSRDAEFVISTDWRGITRRDRNDGGSMPEWIGHPIKSRGDWDRYKAERLQPGREQRAAGLGKYLAGIKGKDVPVQVGSFPWGVFGTARDLLGAEELLIGFYTEPEMVHDIMTTYTSIWLELYEKVAAVVQIDHIHIWEDMSGKQGSLLSPAMIEDFMMPEYDRIAAFAKGHGIPLVSVDSDGRVDELVPVMMKHGVNAFMPFEVQAGCDVESYRKEYPSLGIMGGLDKRALAAGRTEMHHELDRASRMLASGGWIPGFDHLIPPDVPWNNYKYFVENLKKMIGI
ncbi:MAG: hypothetical protein C0404_04020 [Verrucomicrobia bacterium]|nr:hypothetical protein [Verrucomicrobiota bacterium]